MSINYFLEKHSISIATPHGPIYPSVILNEIISNYENNLFQIITLVML